MIKSKLILMLFLFSFGITYSQVTIKTESCEIFEIGRVNSEICASFDKAPFGTLLSVCPNDGIVVLISNISDSIILVQNPLGSSFKKDYSELISNPCQNSFVVDFNKDLVSDPLPTLRDHNLFQDDDFIIKPSESVILKVSGIKLTGVDSLISEIVTATFKFYYSNITLKEKDGLPKYAWPEVIRSIPIRYVWYSGM